MQKYNTPDVGNLSPTAMDLYPSLVPAFESLIL